MNSELFNSIAKFYGGSTFPEARFFDLALTAGSVGQAIGSGSKVHLSRFDGTTKRTVQLPQTSRADSAECLALLATAITGRIEGMPQAEIDELDRTAQMLNAIDVRSLT